MIGPRHGQATAGRWKEGSMIAEFKGFLLKTNAWPSPSV